MFREKNTCANAMIKQHFVRAFERGARRGHRTNTGLKTDACEVIFDTEDSMNVYQMGAFSPQLRIFIYYAELHDISILLIDMHTRIMRARYAKI